MIYLSLSILNNTNILWKESKRNIPATNSNNCNEYLDLK